MVMKGNDGLMAYKVGLLEGSVLISPILFLILLEALSSEMRLSCPED